MPPERTPRRSTLLTRYKQLIDKDLPLAAKNKSDAQPRWPVHLNHCFGRIILDHICQRPWREIIDPPAVKHMSVAQLGKAVEVGEGILGGTIDLERLNRESLQMRAKSRSESESKSNINETLGHAVLAGSDSPPASTSTSTSAVDSNPRARQANLQAKAKRSDSETKPKKTIRDYFKVQ